MSRGLPDDEGNKSVPDIGNCVSRHWEVRDCGTFKEWEVLSQRTVWGKEKRERARKRLNHSQS